VVSNTEQPLILSPKRKGQNACSYFTQKPAEMSVGNVTSTYIWTDGTEMNSTGYCTPTQPLDLIYPGSPWCVVAASQRCPWGVWHSSPVQCPLPATTCFASSSMACRSCLLQQQTPGRHSDWCGRLKDCAPQTAWGSQSVMMLH
jgi:hypothetical protein